MALIYGRVLWRYFIGVIKKYSMEQLEDEYDEQIAEISHKRWVKEGKQTVSMNEMLEEFENV